MTDVPPGAALRGAVDLSALRNRPAPSAAGPVAPASAPSLVMDVTDETFPQVLELSRSVPVVIDLWAEWCGPCKAIGPILEEVAKEYDGKILIAKMDVDANQAVPAKFGIRGIPTLILFKNGVAAAQKVGAMAKGQLTSFIDSNI